MRVDWSLPAWGWPLLCVAAILCVVWTQRAYLRADPPPRRSVRNWLISLRAVVFIVLLLALAGPMLIHDASRGLPPEVAVVLDDSASMAAVDGPQGASRWSQALRLAALADSVVRARAPGARVVLWRGNGLQAAREIRRRDATDPPVGVGTDLKALLREAVTAAAGRPLRAVLLVCDGHDTALDGGAAFSAPAGAPFLAVGVGDPVGPPDLAIQELRYPEVAYQGEEIAVEVTVALRGATAGTVARPRVLVQRDGQVVAEATAAATAREGVVTFEVPLRAPVSGLLVWNLDVEPLVDERFLANNRATIAVDVRPDRARLLLLAGSPGWDARFLAQAANRAGRVALSVVHPGTAGAVLADSGRAWTSPRDAAGWHRWNGVVLLGWSRLEPLVDWPSLATAVRERLGLLVLPGDDAGGNWIGPPRPLAALLPVDSEAAVWLPGDWIAQGTAPQAHSLLSGVTQDVTAGQGLDSGRWPPLRAVLTATVRPGAQMLLEAVQAGDEQGTGVPLLVAGRPGGGRVTWFGGRRLWELAFWEHADPSGGAVSHPGRRLLQNLLLWTATGEGREGISLTGHRRVYEEGERIRLEAHWRDSQGNLAATRRPLTLALRALDDSAWAVRSFALAPVPADSSRAAVTLPPLPAGRWAARPVASGTPAVEGLEEEFLVVPQAIEAAQTRQDRRALRALAVEAGGAYLGADVPGARERLAAAVAGWPLTAAAQPVRRSRDLSAGWPLLAVIVILLSTEWLLRRTQGLP